MGIRYKVNEVFFDQWSDQMAYVLGFLYADGSLEDASYIRGKYVRVTNTDHDRIEAIKKLLDSEHTVVQEDKGGNYKRRYLLRIGNSKMYDQLISLGLTPRKSLTMKFPKVPEKYLGPFVRGYFDGDGCVYLEMRATGRPKRLLTVFTSGSKAFLQQLHLQLQSHAGIAGSGLYAHGSTKGAYQLRYSSEDSSRLFKLMYGKAIEPDLFLRRKYDIFKRYFKLHAESPHSRLEFNGLVAKKSTRRSAKLICEGANPSQASNRI